MRATILVAVLASLQLVQIVMCAAEHPDGEGELEVRVRDRHALVEDALHRLLGPRAVLQRARHRVSAR